MYITIKAKTETGEEALKKLMQARTGGLATRSMINSEPYTVKIIPKGIQNMVSKLRINQYLIPTIEAPTHQMMKDFGANKEDYELAVVV